MSNISDPVREHLARKLLVLIRYEYKYFLTLAAEILERNARACECLGEHREAAAIRNTSTDLQKAIRRACEHKHEGDGREYDPFYDAPDEVFE